MPHPDSEGHTAGLFLSPEGVQTMRQAPRCIWKGIILGNLLIKIFDKLGIHCTNFGSVVEKFNSDMEFKSFLFIGQP